MRSNSPGGQSRGIIRRSTRTPGSRAVLVLADATALSIASQASRLAQRGASLERGAVALPGQQGDGERVLARLVPAVRQPVGIGRDGIAFTEVPRIHRHGSRTSIARVKWAIMAGVSTGPRPPPLSSVWLAKQPIAARFIAAARGGSGTRSAWFQGTRGSAGEAQCHIQTG